MDSRSIVVGVDIGGSHITSALVDVTSRGLVDGTKIRLSVNSKGSANEILGVWREAIKKTIEIGGYSIKKIAFAMPGPFDYERGIALIKGLDKYETLYGVNVKKFFMEVIAGKEEDILFRNDAEAFLHGEMFCGVGMDIEKAIGLTLGTGFGSAISSEGVTKDLNLGSVSFKETIADDYFSTRWFVKRYREITGIVVEDVKAMMEFIIKDKLGLEIFEEYADNLSLFLEEFIRTYAVRYIIIGGNISLVHSFFIEKVRLNLLRNKLNVVFMPAKLNEDAALIGAAASFETLVV